ncbi:acetyltransferase [Vibrio cholerae]|nr:acetyltransferase [Vibrio cholerae]
MLCLSLVVVRCQPLRRALYTYKEVIEWVRFHR